MVLLAGLPLVSCSEKITTVSISGYNKVTKKQASTPLSKYRRRPAAMKHLSLHEYFFEDNKDKKDCIIPHYVGSSTTPIYPFTEAFARCMLIIHKPWHGTSSVTSGNKVEELQAFLETNDCPNSLKLACARAKERYTNKSAFKEPTAENEESGGSYGVDGIDQQAIDIVELVSTFNIDGVSDENGGAQGFHRGLDFDWARKRYPHRDPEKCCGNWLQAKINAFRENEEKEGNSQNRKGKDDLRIPSRTDETGKKLKYDIDKCNTSQKKILLMILNKLKEYFDITDNATRNNNAFTPLRLTIMGEAGTGKSFLINTITAAVRTIFQDNDVVHVTGPTGTFYYMCMKMNDCQNNQKSYTKSVHSQLFILQQNRCSSQQYKWKNNAFVVWYKRQCTTNTTGSICKKTPDASIETNTCADYG